LTDNTCTHCRGTGWLLVDEDGRELARECACKQSDLLQYRLKEANIPPRFAHSELKSYFPGDNVSLKKGLKAAVKFVRDYPALAKGILFQGSVGLGKTRLLCSIAFELVRDKQADVFYIDWNDLLKRLGENFASRDFVANDLLLNKLGSVPLLIFDKLGATRGNTWDLENVYYLVNRRYNENRLTLFASNFFDAKASIESELLAERVGQRIRSRLHEMAETVTLQGADYRNTYG
jgi:DNA replication protein DnaC